MTTSRLSIPGLAGSVPPLEAECSVLAAMLLSEEAIVQARALLTADAFYSQAHSLIFGSIVALNNRGEKADLVTVSAELRRKGELEIVGGPSAVAGILELATTSANVAAHCRLVLDGSARRRISSLGLTIHRLAIDSTLAGHDIITRAEAETSAVASSLAGTNSSRIEITRLSAVVAQPVEWLWPGRIPLGMLSVFDGDPGLGESTVTLDLAARVSRGRSMPDDSAGPPASGCVILSAEDDLARVIRPRLDAAEADVHRIVTVAMRGERGIRRDPTICPEDLVAVEQGIQEVAARLVIVDPLMAYLPSDINAHRDQDVRRALALLTSLAERTGAAVLAVRHLNKSGGGVALYRGGGSIGIVAAARGALILLADPDDAEARVLDTTKSNLAAKQPALRLRLVVNSRIACPRVHWEGLSEHTADDLLAAAGNHEGRTKVDAAVDFLRVTLGEGSLPQRDVERHARMEGISLRTLRRARTVLGVIVEKVGQPGERGQHWTWRLPVGGDEGHSNRSKTAENGHLRASQDANAFCGNTVTEGGHTASRGHLQTAPLESSPSPPNMGLISVHGWETMADHA